MTWIRTDDGASLHVDAVGPLDAPPVLLLNSLGTDLSMWDPQVPALSEHHRVIRYDARGHGQSDATPAPYSIERLGRDAVAIMDAFEVQQANLCGSSLGGLTALWVAIEHPNRTDRAVFGNTAARIGTREGWQERIDAVRAGGIAAIAPAIVARFLGDRFRAEDPGTEQALIAGLAATPPEGYVGACTALRDADLRARVGMIAARSLVIGGTADVATPWAQSMWLHEQIAGSDLVVLAGAAHLSNLERPGRFTAAVLAHFSE